MSVLVVVSGFLLLCVTLILTEVRYLPVWGVGVVNAVLGTDSLSVLYFVSYVARNIMSQLMYVWGGV